MTTHLLNQLDYQNNTEWRVYFIFVFTMANCTALFLTLVVGLGANVFVVWSVIHQKSLQTSNNALLVNLAIIDLIRCTVDCPLLLSIELRAYGIGPPGALLCDAQMLSFSFICSVQLLTLASISVERYQAVANPFQNKQRRKRITVWIPLTWTVALLLSVLCKSRPRDAPIYLKCNGIDLRADSLSDTFGRYILIPIWSGCFSVVIGFYGRIFWIVRTHNKKIFDKGVLPPPKMKLKIASDDGKTVQDKNNEKEEHESKKTESVKVETQKEDPHPVAATKQPRAIETREGISVREGQSWTETGHLTTPEIPVISLDATASGSASPEVITMNNCQPTPQSPKTENATIASHSSSPPSAAAKKPEAIENKRPGPTSVREGPLLATTAKITTPEIPVISLDATTSSTPSLQVTAKNNFQPAPPSLKTEKKTFIACSSTGATTRQPQSIETESIERASEKITSAIPVIPLDAATSCTASPEIVMTNDCQSAPLSTKVEKKTVSFQANRLKDLEGNSAKTAGEPDPKSAVNVKVEEVPPLPAAEAPNTDAKTNAPAEQDNQEAAGAVCMMPSKVSKERASKKKEGKLAKRSGYIILTFVMFWTPLIVSIVVNFFVHKYNTKQVWITTEAEILSISVACMTSATNPITYAAVNPQFRTEFRKLNAKCGRVKELFLKRKR